MAITTVGAATTERPHGYAKYKLEGCRCYTCAWATSEYNTQRERAIAAGTWQPFIDAEPVRQHVKLLMASGIGRRRISKLAGVSDTNLQHLVHGKTGRVPARRVRHEVAAKLLAITPEPANLAAGSNVDATGTHRRIQALACLGWTLTEQAQRIGWNVANYSWLLQRAHVVQGTADKVRALYDELSMRKAPDGYGSTRVRNLAVARGWVPPLAWDDDEIDDPAAKPIGAVRKARVA